MRLAIGTILSSAVVDFVSSTAEIRRLADIQYRGTRLVPMTEELR